MLVPRAILRLLGAAALLLVAASAGAQQLYWLDTRYGAPSINRCDADGGGLQSLALPPGSLPEGLVVDAATASVYWTEAAFAGARLRRCGLDLSSPTDVLTGGSALRGLALDGAAGGLLWTTSNQVSGATVRRAARDGSDAATLVALGASSNPRGIAWAPPGALFLCDTDGIHRYDLAGAGGLLIPLAAAVRPYGVAVDTAAGLVYWTEARKGRIGRATVAGADPTVLVSGLAHPTYLALDPAGGRMFWVEGGAGEQGIRRANLDGSAVQDLGLPVTTYGGIAFLAAGPLAAPGGGGEPALELALRGAGPNPAGAEARLEFALPREQHVRLGVHDALGREVAVLADGLQAAGRHSVSWRTAGARPGLYFARLRTESGTRTRRLTVLR